MLSLINYNNKNSKKYTFLFLTNYKVGSHKKKFLKKLIIIEIIVST